MPESLQNDPRYPLLLEPSVSDDEETDSADSDCEEKETVKDAAVDDSQVS